MVMSIIAIAVGVIHAIHADRAVDEDPDPPVRRRWAVCSASDCRRPTLPVAGSTCSRSPPPSRVLHLAQARRSNPAPGSGSAPRAPRCRTGSPTAHCRRQQGAPPAAADREIVRGQVCVSLALSSLTSVSDCAHPGSWLCRHSWCRLSLADCARPCATPDGGPFTVPCCGPVQRLSRDGRPPRRSMTAFAAPLDEVRRSVVAVARRLGEVGAGSGEKGAAQVGSCFMQPRQAGGGPRRRAGELGNWFGAPPLPRG